MSDNKPKQYYMNQMPGEREKPKELTEKEELLQALNEMRRNYASSSGFDKLKKVVDPKDYKISVLEKQVKELQENYQVLADKLMDLTGESISKVNWFYKHSQTKRYDGLEKSKSYNTYREAFNDATYFGTSFPPDLFIWSEEIQLDNTNENDSK